MPKYYTVKPWYKNPCSYINMFPQLLALWVYLLNVRISQNTRFNFKLKTQGVN